MPSHTILLLLKLWFFINLTFVRLSELSRYSDHIAGRKRSCLNLGYSSGSRGKKKDQNVDQDSQCLSESRNRGPWDTNSTGSCLVRTFALFQLSPKRKQFCVALPLYLQAFNPIVPWNRPRTLPYKSFTIHYSFHRPLVFILGTGLPIKQHSKKGIDIQSRNSV
jgi:hypothetical protein